MSIIRDGCLTTVKASLGPLTFLVARHKRSECPICRHRDRPRPVLASGRAPYRPRRARHAATGLGWPT